jgi:predicted secreted protein
MPVTTGIAIFFLIWWIALFAVLPWGIRSQHEDGAVVPGTDPGAPVLPRLRRVLVWTTVVSIVVFAGCYVIYAKQLITVEGFMKMLGSPI